MALRWAQPASPTPFTGDVALAQVESEGVTHDIREVEDVRGHLNLRSGPRLERG